METDLTSILIAIVALSFFFVPVMYDKISNKKGSRKMEKLLLDSAGNLQLTITKHDVWHDSYAIGIDQESGRLLYLKKKPEKNQEVLIHLTEVKHCRVSKSDRNIKSGNKRLNITEKIELCFSYSNSKRPDNCLEFYNGRKGDSLGNEVSLAEKWAEIINSSLAKDQLSPKLSLKQ